MLSPAGAPSHSARIASTTTLTDGVRHSCRPPGIDSTGTNVEEMNVIGKISVKPSPFAASGEETDRAISAKIHENAGQRAEAVDQPLLQVLGETQSCHEPAEGDVLEEPKT
jgi:hypothetical protein